MKLALGLNISGMILVGCNRSRLWFYMLLLIATTYFCFLFIYMSSFKATSGIYFFLEMGKRSPPNDESDGLW